MRGMEITNTKESAVTTSTVELKTSTLGVTRTERIKTGYSDVNDYARYLQSKYGYMNTGTTSMQGIPTTVSVSGAFLKKCMNDPEKAKYLEENLAAIPDCAKIAVRGCLGTLTSLSYMIDDNGNIAIAGSGSSDPDGKIARENAKKKAREDRQKEEKLKEKRKAKREEEERQEAKRAEKKAARELEMEQGEYTIRVIGMDIKAVTQKAVTASWRTPTFQVTGFDSKV